MYFTEDEAMRKWCPFVRQSNSVEGTWNRFASGHISNEDNYTCIGSRCMAWRAVEQWRPRSDYPWRDGAPDTNGPNVERRSVGRCGLAGA